MSSSSRSSNIFDTYLPIIEADQRQKAAGYSRRKPGPTATRPPSKQLNIRIDETLHEKLSSYAYINRVSMRELIEGFIESLSM